MRERQIIFAETLSARSRDAAALEMLCPPSQRAQRRCVGDRGDLPCPGAARVARLPDRKGGVERARLTQFISEIQMVDRRRAVVEHSSLDKPLPKDLHHQIDITLRRTGRSEEHTSELQSLMRISYAVFCLKK